MAPCFAPDELRQSDFVFARLASVAACRAGASLTSLCGSSISRQLLSNLTLISQRYLMLNDRGEGQERRAGGGGSLVMHNRPTVIRATLKITIV